MNKSLFFFMISMIASNNPTLQAVQSALLESSELPSKNSCLLKNGITFDTFESQFREKYSNLSIPEIQIINGSESGYRFFDKKILLGNERLAKSTSDRLEWSILHELGHHNHSRILRESPILSAMTTSVALAFLHGRKHANKLALMTRVPWAIMARGMFPNLLCSVCVLETSPIIRDRVKECMADNFANKYASLEALKAGYHDFKTYDQEEKVAIKEGILTGSQNSLKKKQELRVLTQEEQKEHEKTVQFALSHVETVQTFWSLWLDSAHPSSKSRATKINKAANDRFGIDLSQK